jgi:ribonuclease VapC
LTGESGADQVDQGLLEGGVVGAANWSEVAQKTRQHGRDWGRAKALLLAYELEVTPVITADAEWAATRWRAGEGLSLADRLCLALGARLDATVWTADAGWTGSRIRKIR